MELLTVSLIAWAPQGLARLNTPYVYPELFPF